MHINIPTRAKAGSVVPITCDPATRAFSAGIYKNAKKVTVKEHGRDVQRYRGELIQVEQENTKAEGPAIDGVIHIELYDKNGPFAKGIYLIRSVAVREDGSDRLSKESLIEVV